MKKRILVIDDDGSILDALIEVLEYENYEVRALESIENIFMEVDSFAPNVILIDFILQSINGGEICHQIKTSEKHEHIPVFLMSAYPGVLYSLGTYNADGVIEKPFDLDELVTRLNRETKINAS